jgi:hypothetical protein
MTRFYTGVNGANSFCYQIVRITKNGFIDKRFKPLYCFATDDFSTVGEFHHWGSGEVVRVYKKPFKTVYGVSDRSNPIAIWEESK